MRSLFLAATLASMLAACSFDEGGVATIDAQNAIPDGPSGDASVGIDATTIDASTIDGTVIDAPVIDAPVIDAPVVDAAVPDAPLPDAPLPDAPLPDAPLPDAPLPDAFVADAGVVETLTVPCDGTIVTSTTVLMSGTTYMLRASGTCDMGPFSADAEYYNFSSPVDGNGTTDYGIGIDDNTLGAVTPPDWGPYDASHIYTVNYPGTGATITARYHDGVDYSNNSGSLTVEILAP